MLCSGLRETRLGSTPDKNAGQKKTGILCRSYVVSVPPAHRCEKQNPTLGPLITASIQENRPESALFSDLGHAQNLALESFENRPGFPVFLPALKA